jgi:hypothetical protein
LPDTGLSAASTGTPQQSSRAMKRCFIAPLQAAFLLLCIDPIYKKL